jgi:hypothetical protein
MNVIFFYAECHIFTMVNNNPNIHRVNLNLLVQDSTGNTTRRVVF